MTRNQMGQGGVGVRLRIVLSCLLLLVQCDLGAVQVRLSEGTIVLEPDINEKVLALKPEQVPILTERANADDVEAQCVLGVAYERGSSVPRDEAQAIKWLTKVATRGVSWAQNLLAVFISVVGMFHPTILKRLSGSAPQLSNAIRQRLTIWATCS